MSARHDIAAKTWLKREAKRSFAPQYLVLSTWYLDEEWPARLRAGP